MYEKVHSFTGDVRWLFQGLFYVMTSDITIVFILKAECSSRNITIGHHPWMSAVEYDF